MDLGNPAKIKLFFQDFWICVSEYRKTVCACSKSIYIPYIRSIRVTKSHMRIASKKSYQHILCAGEGGMCGYGWVVQKDTTFLYFFEPLSWTVDWSPVNLERALVRDAYLRPTGEIRGAVSCGCSLWSDLRAFSPTCWRWALCESLGAEKIREAPFWKVVSSSRHCPNSSPPLCQTGTILYSSKKYAWNIQLNGPLFKKGLS